MSLNNVSGWFVSPLSTCTLLGYTSYRAHKMQVVGVPADDRDLFIPVGWTYKMNVACH